MLANQDARDLLYRCYSGHWSAFYYAAQTGIVQSFNHMREECALFSQPELATWIEYQSQHAPLHKSFWGGEYWLLPWAKELEKTAAKAAG